MDNETTNALLEIVSESRDNDNRSERSRDETLRRKFEMTFIPYSQIIVDESLSPRFERGVNDNPLLSVEAHHRPSIRLVQVGDEPGYLLIDGYKTLDAIRVENNLDKPDSNGEAWEAEEGLHTELQIEAIVCKVDSLEEAFALAVLFNSRHGEPLTLEEKQAAAWRLNEQGMTQDEIRGIFNVNQSTISRWISAHAESLSETETTASASVCTANAPAQTRHMSPEELQTRKEYAKRLRSLAKKVASPEVVDWENVLRSELQNILDEMDVDEDADTDDEEEGEDEYEDWDEGSDTAEHTPPALPEVAARPSQE